MGEPINPFPLLKQFANYLDENSIIFQQRANSFRSDSPSKQDFIEAFKEFPAKATIVDVFATPGTDKVNILSLVEGLEFLQRSSLNLPAIERLAQAASKRSLDLRSIFSYSDRMRSGYISSEKFVSTVSNSGASISPSDVTAAAELLSFNGQINYNLLCQFIDYSRVKQEPTIRANPVDVPNVISFLRKVCAQRRIQPETLIHPSSDGTLPVGTFQRSVIDLKAGISVKEVQALTEAFIAPSNRVNCSAFLIQLHSTESEERSPPKEVIPILSKIAEAEEKNLSIISQLFKEKDKLGRGRVPMGALPSILCLLHVRLDENELRSLSESYEANGDFSYVQFCSDIKMAPKVSKKEGPNEAAPALKHLKAIFDVEMANPFEVFHSFDIGSRGLISAPDFEKAIRSFRFHLSRQEFDLIFSEYGGKTGMVNYRSLIDAIARVQLGSKERSELAESDSTKERNNEAIASLRIEIKSKLEARKLVIGQILTEDAMSPEEFVSRLERYRIIITGSQIADIMRFYANPEGRIEAKRFASDTSNSNVISLPSK